MRSHCQKLRLHIRMTESEHLVVMTQDGKYTRVFASWTLLRCPYQLIHCGHTLCCCSQFCICYRTLLLWPCIYISLHEKCPLLSYDFNQTCTYCTGFCKTSEYNISRKLSSGCCVPCRCTDERTYMAKQIVTFRGLAFKK
jgi:hypothetical protein